MPKSNHPSISDEAWKCLSEEEQAVYLTNRGRLTQLNQELGYDAKGLKISLSLGVLAFWYAVFSLPGLFLALYDDLGSGGLLITGFIITGIGTVWRCAFRDATVWLRDSPAAIGVLMMANAVLGGLITFSLLTAACVIYIGVYLFLVANGKTKA